MKKYLRLRRKPDAIPGGPVAVEGIWALTKAVRGGVPFEVMFVCPELIYSDETSGFIHERAAEGVVSLAVSRRLIERLVERERPDGVAAIVRPPQRRLEDIRLDDSACVVVLDGLEIPGNVGTIIRSADSSGVSAVVLTSERTHLSHSRVIHGSMGSVFVIATVVALITDVVAWLRSNNFRIVTASTRGGHSYRRVSYGSRCALVLGSERFGISPEWHDNEDMSVRIPVLGASDSINVGHAASPGSGGRGGRTPSPSLTQEVVVSESTILCTRYVL